MLYEDEVEDAKRRGKTRDDVRRSLVDEARHNFALNEYLLLLGADQLIRNHDRTLRARSDAVPGPVFLDTPSPVYRTRAEMAEHTRRVKQDYKDYWSYILFSGKPLRSATRLDILESVEKRRAQVRGHEVHIAKELSIAAQLPNDTITVGEWLARRERDGRSPPPPEPRPTA